MVERRSAQDFVRCPESGSVRFSEVANILQLWYFQSVTRQVSVVAWVSASRRVRYGRFHCISLQLNIYSEAETACQKWGGSVFMKWGLLLSF